MAFTLDLNALNSTDGSDEQQKKRKRDEMDAQPPASDNGGFRLASSSPQPVAATSEPNALSTIFDGQEKSHTEPPAEAAPTSSYPQPLSIFDGRNAGDIRAETPSAFYDPPAASSPASKFQLDASYGSGLKPVALGATSNLDPPTTQLRERLAQPSAGSTSDPYNEILRNGATLSTNAVRQEGDLINIVQSRAASRPPRYDPSNPNETLKPNSKAKSFLLNLAYNVGQNAHQAAANAAASGRNVSGADLLGNVAGGAVASLPIGQNQYQDERRQRAYQQQLYDAETERQVGNQKFILDSTLNTAKQVTQPVAGIGRVENQAADIQRKASQGDVRNGIAAFKAAAANDVAWARVHLGEKQADNLKKHYEDQAKRYESQNDFDAGRLEEIQRRTDEIVKRTGILQQNANTNSTNATTNQTRVSNSTAHYDEKRAGEATKAMNDVAAADYAANRETNPAKKQAALKYAKELRQNTVNRFPDAVQQGDDGKLSLRPRGNGGAKLPEENVRAKAIAAGLDPDIAVERWKSRKDPLGISK